jgi:hypothetical protein
MKRWMDRLPWAAAALITIGALAWLALDPRIPRKAFEEYSLYNTSPRGLSLASRYLASTGRRVGPLTRPVDRASLPRDAVLFRIRPEISQFLWPVRDEKSVVLKPRDAWEFPLPPNYPFTPEEEDWVRGGGRLVLAIDRPYSSIDVQPVDLATPRKVLPLWPGVARLDPPATRSIQGAAGLGGVTVFEVGEKAAIVRQRRSRGDIILCALPELFQNAQLGRADHLALLDRLAETGRPVFFDEYVHGLQADVGTLEILRRWGFGPFLLTILAAALAWFWRRRVRLGPEEDDARETRVEAVDFVDSLALLYRRMLPRRQALQLYSKAFEKAVSVQTGLRDGALEARVRELLPLRPARPARGKDLTPNEFARELESINLAFRRLNDAKRPGKRRSPAAGPRSA